MTFPPHPSLSLHPPLIAGGAVRSRPAGRILPVCVRCLFPPTPISLHFAVPLVRSPRARARPCPPAPSPPACRAPPPLRLPPAVCCRLPIPGGAHALRGVSRAGRAPAGCGVCVGCGGGGARARAPPPGPFPYRPPLPPPSPWPRPRARTPAPVLPTSPPLFFHFPARTPLPSTHARTPTSPWRAGLPSWARGEEPFSSPPSRIWRRSCLFFFAGVLSVGRVVLCSGRRARALFGV